MYRVGGVNTNGEDIPPCLTPFETVKSDEVFLPHFTQRVCCLYQLAVFINTCVSVYNFA